MRNWIALLAVLIYLSAIERRRTTPFRRHDQIAWTDSPGEPEHPQPTPRDEAREPDAPAHPWSDQVHALLQAQLWEFKEEAQQAPRNPRPMNRADQTVAALLTVTSRLR